MGWRDWRNRKGKNLVACRKTDADEIFTKLMSVRVVPRRKIIEKNAPEVPSLDI